MAADTGDGAEVPLKVDSAPLSCAGVALALVHCLLFTPYHKLVHLVGGEGETGGGYGLALTADQLHALL